MSHLWKKVFLFQNLIGMLGRCFLRTIRRRTPLVSKPYRYARKLCIFKKEILEKNVSKPYRYARKCCSREEIVTKKRGFKTL